MRTKVGRSAAAAPGLLRVPSGVSCFVVSVAASVGIVATVEVILRTGMPEAERSTGEFWPFTVRYRGLSRQGPRIESGRSSLFYPPRDVPAGQVDLPSAGEVHDLIIPVVLGGVIASHLAVAEAEHIARSEERRVGKECRSEGRGEY